MENANEYVYEYFVQISNIQFSSEQKIHAVLILKDRKYLHSPKFILMVVIYFFGEFANDLTRVLDYR